MEIISFSSSQSMNSSARIRPFLSLSRLRSFTFIDIPYDPNPAPEMANLPLGVRISIDYLVLHLTPPSLSYEHRRSLHHLPALFNPTRFTLASLPPHRENTFIRLRPGSLGLWDRIQHVRLLHSTFAVGIQLFQFRRTQSWTVAYELPLPFNKDGSPSSTLTRTVRDLLDGLESRFGDDLRGRVDPGGTIVVSSEEEKAKVETLLLTSSRELSRGDEQRRVEFMRHISVLVGQMLV